MTETESNIWNTFISEREYFLNTIYTHSFLTNLMFSKNVIEHIKTHCLVIIKPQAFKSN